MALPWPCHGKAMALPWPWPWPCHGRGMAVPWPYHGPAMASPWPWTCHGHAMALPWPWLCHGPAMAMAIFLCYGGDPYLNGRSHIGSVKTWEWLRLVWRCQGTSGEYCNLSRAPNSHIRNVVQKLKIQKSTPHSYPPMWGYGGTLLMAMAVAIAIWQGTGFH